MAEWILCLDELTIYNWRMKKTFFSFLSFVIQRMRLSKYNILFCCHLQPLKEKLQIASSLAVYQIIEKFDSSSFFLFFFLQSMRYIQRRRRQRRSFIQQRWSRLFQRQIAQFTKSSIFLSFFDFSAEQKIRVHNYTHVFVSCALSMRCKNLQT